MAVSDRACCEAAPTAQAWRSASRTVVNFNISILQPHIGQQRPSTNSVVTTMGTIQTQAQANAFWEGKDYKKWVVDFTAGPRRNRKTAQVLVGAPSSTAARRVGISACELMGKAWVRSAASSVRLATAQDLGCVRTNPITQETLKGGPDAQRN
ncbi:hypothetical protein [Curvibacter gracilis]|uniref:hypothetical protein n=1 Tax=Curvibacter gracilis TaxID=230310 RepID=UPI0012FC2B6E|nr:hypothetical protein [Curvibacter gracilis]